MRITMILPALTEATSPLFRPIKYSLFPPLGLATLAGYLRPDDEAAIHDEHVQRLRLDDDRPDLAVIQVYITSARRAYQLADAYRARGVHVVLGGRTVEWAVEQGIETATFHIMTPYPGTALFERMDAQGRIVHRDWDSYDTRHVVFSP